MNAIVKTKNWKVIQISHYSQTICVCFNSIPGKKKYIPSQINTEYQPELGDFIHKSFQLIFI